MRPVRVSPKYAETRNPVASINPPTVATSRGPLRSCHSPPTIAPTATISSEYRYGVIVCALVQWCNCVSGPRKTDHEYTTALMACIQTAIQAWRARLGETTIGVAATAGVIGLY